MNRFGRFIPPRVYVKYFRNKFGRFVSPKVTIHGSKSKGTSKEG